MTELLDQPGSDTWLARALLQSGQVDPSRLQEALWAARAGGGTLAQRLVSCGDLSEAEALAALSGLGGETPKPPRSSAAPARSVWRAGARVGDYELGRELGSGGMGQVFQARHVRSNATCALKTLLPTFDLELLQRFRREGEAQAALPPHLAIAQVHSAGEAEGRLFLAMELVEGVDLAERLRQGPLAPDEAATIVAALAGGLQHAHDHGVLHRDLKPANVLVGKDGRPKLVDFGLARVAWEGSLTQSGAIMGTPAYMPPEQIESARAVDERGDVYGLGAILYHCLTGRAPFAGGTVLSILEQVTTAPPTPIRQLQPQVPAWLEAVCAKALAKRPEDRFGSAAALADALESESAPAARPWAALVCGGLVLAAALAGVAAASLERPVALPSPEPISPTDLVLRAGPARAEAREAMTRGEFDRLAAVASSDRWVLKLQAAGRTLQGQERRGDEGHLVQAARSIVALQVSLNETLRSSRLGGRQFVTLTTAEAKRDLLLEACDAWETRLWKVDREGRAEMKAVGVRFVVTAADLLFVISDRLRRKGNRADAWPALEALMNRILAAAPQIDASPLRQYLQAVVLGEESLERQVAAKSLVLTPTERLHPDLVSTALIVHYLAKPFDITAERIQEGEALLRREDAWRGTYVGQRQVAFEHGRTLWRAACAQAMSTGELNERMFGRGRRAIQRSAGDRYGTVHVFVELVLCDIARGALSEAEGTLKVMSADGKGKRLLLRTELALARRQNDEAASLLGQWGKTKGLPEPPQQALLQSAQISTSNARTASLIYAASRAKPLKSVDIPWRTPEHILAVTNKGAWWPGRDR